LLLLLNCFSAILTQWEGKILQDITPERIEFYRLILFIGNTGAKKDE
jgi:hypothetical protein